MKLYPYQQKTFEDAKLILSKHKMVYLALEMRYGKTPIAMELIRHLDKKALFVTTKSAMKDILSAQLSMNISTPITVINYESLHKVQGKFDTLVLDEAHQKISKFPKPSSSRLAVDHLTTENTRVIWMSGSPAIESSSKLYHQLSISPYHSFSKFKNFYRWHDMYGIKGLSIYTGGSRPAVDYSQTIDFSQRFEKIMVRRTLEASGRAVVSPKIHLVYIDIPPSINDVYDAIMKHSIYSEEFTVVADGGAGRLTKLHQLAQGSVIDELDNTVLISPFKAKAIAEAHKGKKVAVFYKYIADYKLLSTFFNKEDLYQIDSAVTGINLSHYDEMAVMSLTFSGSNYSQMMSRMLHPDNKEQPNVYVYLTNHTVDTDVYKAVSLKRDYNSKFLRA